MATCFRNSPCFALFCAASSALYLANDVADRASDVHHPLKRNRPIASGRLSPSIAIAASAVLTLVALAAKLTLAGTVAAPVLLELRFIVKPPAGAGADKFKVRF